MTRCNKDKKENIEKAIIEKRERNVGDLCELWQWILEERERRNKMVEYWNNEIQRIKRALETRADILEGRADEKIMKMVLARGPEILKRAKVDVEAFDRELSRYTTGRHEQPWKLRAKYLETPVYFENWESLKKRYVSMAVAWIDAIIRLTDIKIKPILLGEKQEAGIKGLNTFSEFNMRVSLCWREAIDNIREVCRIKKKECSDINYSIEKCSECVWSKLNEEKVLLARKGKIRENKRGGHKLAAVTCIASITGEGERTIEEACREHKVRKIEKIYDSIIKQLLTAQL